MKGKQRFFALVLVSFCFILTSCQEKLFGGLQDDKPAVSQQDNKEQEDTAEKPEDIQKDSIITEFNMPLLKEIKFDAPNKYNGCTAVFLDENNILVCFSYSNESGSGTSKFYRYDLENDKAEQFHEENEFLMSEYYTNAKKLKNGNIAFITNTKILIFDKKTLKVVKTYTPPEGISQGDIDISYSGDKAAYTYANGLYSSAIDFSRPRLLIKGTGEAEKAKEARYPIWSKDDSKIFYTMVGYEWVEGIGAIGPDWANKYYFDYEGKYDLCMNHLFTNNKKILLEDAHEPSSHAILDIDKNELTKFDTENACTAEAKVYISDSKVLMHKDNQYYLLDIDSNEKINVCESKENLNIYAWSPSYKRILVKQRDKNEDVSWYVWKLE